MAKNSKDAYGAIGKTNSLTFDPATLTLVTDPEHPLYDERVHLPVDEAMVLNIMHMGVREPIIVTKNTESGAVEVVDGRQRVKCAIEANRRLAGRGEAAVTVSGVVMRGKANELTSVMASTNEIRTQDTPMNRAAKMARLLNRGVSEAEVGVVFGCTVGTVRSTVALLDCSEAVRRAVDAGKIGIIHAKALVKLDPAEQRAKVSELVAAGEGAKPHERAKKQRAVVDTTCKMKGKREIRAEIATSTGARKAALLWVLGEEA
jgi:ParB family chromosome partitioning protein